MYYVYELINLMGTVEYVGQTKYPNKRFREHIFSSPKNIGKGKFYKRQDIFLNIVCECETENIARQIEFEMQNYWNLVTDKSKCGPRGENQKNSKLTNDDVKEIKKLIREKVPGFIIAKKYRISSQTISLIKLNKSWTHVN